MGSSFADLTPGKDIAVGSTWLTMHLQPAQGQVRDVHGGIEGEGQHVPLMYVATWALAEMQVQDVCTSAQPPDDSKEACLEASLTLNSGHVVCLLWVGVPGLPVSCVPLSNLLGLFNLLTLPQWVVGLARHVSW